MIATYVKIVAAIIMFAWPVKPEYDLNPGQFGNSVAVASSPETSIPAQPAQPVQSMAKTRRTAGTDGEKSKPAAQARLAKQVAPNSGEMPRAKTTDLQPAGKTAAESNMARSNNAVSSPAGVAATDSDSSARTTQQQVMAATAVVEQMTAATVVDIDDLVVIVMASPEIKSVSDLTDKNVAIDVEQIGFNANVRTAMAAAGATAVQLSVDQTKAIDRLISGEVPAAVLSLASPEAAQGFPEVAGFKIFRIPVSPGSPRRG
jgi:hypothetical protein